MRIDEVYKLIISRKIVLVGGGRIALDIKYMLPVPVYGILKIKGENYEVSHDMLLGEVDLNNPETLDANAGFLYIVCSAKVTEIISAFAELELREHEDFIRISDVIRLFDIPAGFFDPNKKQILCANGKAYIDCVVNEFIETYGISDMLIDNGEDLINANSNDSVCLIANDRGTNIQKYIEKGYVYGQNLFVLDVKGNRCSDMFIRMMGSNPIDTPMCSHPFEYVEIVPAETQRGISGGVHLCCPMFLMKASGYLIDDSFNNIWNNNISKIIRLSIINRTFAFCKIENCRYKKKDFIDVKYLEKNAIVREDDYKRVEEKYPRHVAIDIDQTCNLLCKYCRKEIYVNGTGRTNNLSIISKKIKDELIENCTELMLAGNGEVFASKYYQDMLFHVKNKSEKTLQLTTNLLLIDKKKLDDICDKYKKIEVWVSIDAASKEKYESVRRNGNWNILINNLELLREYRERNAVTYVRFNYIVTMDSIDEMEEFVGLGKKYKADSILFQKTGKDRCGIYGRI